MNIFKGVIFLAYGVLIKNAFNGFLQIKWSWIFVETGFFDLDLHRLKVT
jgi:hypothetical protein